MHLPGCREGKAPIQLKHHIPPMGGLHSLVWLPQDCRQVFGGIYSVQVLLCKCRHQCVWVWLSCFRLQVTYLILSAAIVPIIDYSNYLVRISCANLSDYHSIWYAGWCKQACTIVLSFIFLCTCMYESVYAVFAQVLAKMANIQGAITFWLQWLWKVEHWCGTRLLYSVIFWAHTWR